MVQNLLAECETNARSCVLVALVEHAEDLKQVLLLIFGYPQASVLYADVQLVW